jgi:hypothetical protein
MTTDRSATELERAATVRRGLPDVEQIGDADLRDKVVRVFVMAWELGGWERWDQGAYWLAWLRRGDTAGEFVSSTTQMALAMAEVMGRVSGAAVNRDHLIAGCLLRDVGKLLEKAPRGQGPLASSLLRHPFTGVHLALTADLPLEVAHIIAASGPEGTFARRTLEASIVAHAEIVAADPILRRELNITADEFIPTMTFLHTPLWDLLQKSWGEWLGPKDPTIGPAEGS